MRLKLNKTLRAALIAAITTVGLTLTQAQAATGTETLTLTKELQPVSGAVVSLSDLTYTWSIAGTPAQKDVSGSFAPDINVGANAGTWTLTFTMTNTYGNEITLDSLLLDVNMYSASGGAQSTSTNRAIAFTLKEGDQTVGSIDTVMQGRGNTAQPSFIYDPGTSSLTDQKPVLTFEGGKTLAANDSVTLSLTAARGSATTFQNGCFFGLLDIVASYTYQASECVWSGETSQIWGETAAWTGGVPSAMTPAIFNENGKNTTVTINSEAAAASVTVSEKDYTFNVQAGGSLAIASELSVTSNHLTIQGGLVTAGSLTVAEGASLTVGEDASLKVSNGQKELMMGTKVTNKGTFVLTTNVSLGNGESTQMGGTLAIQGATVTIGSGEGTTASIESFSHVSLDGGQITVNAQNAAINGVSVANGKTGTVKVEDMKNSPNTVALNGVTQVDGTLNLTNNWNSSFTIEQLSGAGTLNQPAGGAQEMLLTINSLKDFTGTLSLKHDKGNDAININTGTTAVNFNTLELAIGGHTANFTLGANTGIGLAKLTSGTLALSGADTHTLTLGGLEGDATITGLNNLVLNVASGEHVYTGTFAVAGQITKTGAGSQTITGTALHHTILAQGGTLVLNGTYEIKDIAEGEHQTIYVDADDQESANGGFMKNTGSLTVYSVNTAAGAQLNRSNAVFTYDGNVVTEDVQDGAYTLPSDPIMSTVYVKNDSLAFAAFKAKAGETLTTVSLANNTTIVMDEAAIINLVMESGANATVNATAATTLSGVTGLGDGQTLTITGTELVTLGSAVTGNKVVVDNGHLNLGALTHTLSELSVTNGTVDISGVDSKYGCVSGILTIGESGTVTTVGHHDVFGYNDGATDKIVLRGAENKLAKLVLNSPNTNSVTMTTDIEMYGYSAITSTKGDSDKGFNTYGGTIKVEGVENSIDVLDMRHNGVTINVNADGELEIKKVTIFGNQHGENTILVKAGEGLLTLSGASNLSDGLNISAGTVAVGGATTIGNLAGTGDLVVKEGGSLNVTGSVTDTTITVEDGGTIAGGVNASQVGIAAHGTATFDEGVIDEDAGISIVGWESGATVTNNGDTTAKYAGLQDSNMTVAAEGLYSLAERDVDINNVLEVGVIMHEGTGALTLTKVDEDALKVVSTDSANLTIKGITETSLTDLSIGTGATVAVYTDTQATLEGTVTVSETLTAGGATLLANLTIIGNEEGTTTWTLYGEAMTLGSTLKLVTADGLIQLDDETMQNIADLQAHESYALVLDGAGDLTYIGEGWWDQVFTRSYGEGNGLVLTGDYQVGLLDNGNFGVTKLSNVPEPATGTLSLLALAGLCARRRKK